MGLEPESNNIQYPSSISADGTHFVFDEQMRGDSTIYMVPLRGERRVTSLIATMFDERNSQLSGDDRWIACQSNESGRDEVYVRPFPGVDGGRSQVSTGGGDSRCGHRTAGSCLTSIQTGGSWRFRFSSAPASVQAAPARLSIARSYWDSQVSPAGCTTCHGTASVS